MPPTRRWNLAPAFILAAPVIVFASVLPARSANTLRDIPAVYLDMLLSDAGTRRSGSWAGMARPATIDGAPYRHALLTEVSDVRPEERTAGLTLRIDGAYERFQATVGRDDQATADGPAYVYFELWGDNRPLWKSAAIRSASYMVRAAPGSGLGTRRAPQTVDADVSGVRSLRLIVRYARDLAQEGPSVMRARGCVWGDARLLSTGGSKVSAGKTPSAVETPWRNALRGVAVQLAAQMMTQATAAASGPPAPRLPMHLYVAPLEREGGATAGAAFADTEAAQSVLAEMLFAARRAGGGGGVPAASSSLLFAVPPRAVVRSRRERDAAGLLAAAKRAGADVVLRGVVRAAADASGAVGWELETHLTDTETKSDRAALTITLPTEH